METNANYIKLAAVLTAIPRWVVALMAAEGLEVPVEWKTWWVIFSAVSAVGMAIVEGLAFSYIFSAIKKAWALKSSAHLVTLAALGMVSAVFFIAMIAPSISASVRGTSIGEWIKNDAALTMWSAIVAASTIAIVASVGYAETIMQGGQSYQAPRPTAPVFANAKAPEKKAANENDNSHGEIPADSEKNAGNGNDNSQEKFPRNYRPQWVKNHMATTGKSQSQAYRDFEQAHPNYPNK